MEVCEVARCQLAVVAQRGQSVWPWTMTWTIDSNGVERFQWLLVWSVTVCALWTLPGLLTMKLCSYKLFILLYALTHAEETRFVELLSQWASAARFGGAAGMDYGVPMCGAQCWHTKQCTSNGAFEGTSLKDSLYWIKLWVIVILRVRWTFRSAFVVLLIYTEFASRKQFRLASIYTPW